MFRHAAALGALLSALPASAGGVDQLRGGGRPNPAVLRIPANATGAYASPVTADGRAITFIRNSDATFINASGLLQTASAGQLRVESAGMLLEGARTNLALRSEALDNATWVKGNTTVTANTADVLDPFGTNLAEKVAISADVCSANVIQTIALTSGTTYALSFYVRGSATTTAVGFGLFQGSFLTSTGYVLSGSGSISGATLKFVTGLSADTWTRVALVATATSTANGTFYIYPNTSNECAGLTSARVNYVFGGQVEAGSYPSSYIKAEGTAVARSADTTLVANPLTTADRAWCLCGTVTRPNWTAQVATPFSLGSGTTNAGRAHFTTGGNLTFDVYDASAVKSGTYAHGFAAGASKRIAACNNGGTLALYVDGTAQTLTGSGAGTGVIATMPASLYLGYDGTSSPLGGNLTNVVVSRSSDPTRCL